MKDYKRQLIKFLYGQDTNERARNKWISNELAKLDKGKSILDAGAGELKWKKECGHLKYVSQDFCEYHGKGDSKGLQTGDWDTGGIDIVSDITAIPVANNTFDIILCSEVFEHIPYPEKAIKEFSRILKSGGYCCLRLHLAV